MLQTLNTDGPLQTRVLSLTSYSHPAHPTQLTSHTPHTTHIPHPTPPTQLTFHTPPTPPHSPTHLHITLYCSHEVSLGLLANYDLLSALCKVIVLQSWSGLCL